MQTTTITFWQEGEFWLGYLNEYPEYVTQGYSLEELKEHLKDIYADVVSGQIPGRRQTA